MQPGKEIAEGLQMTWTERKTMSLHFSYILYNLIDSFLAASICRGVFVLKIIILKLGKTFPSSNVSLHLCLPVPLSPNGIDTLLSFSSLECGLDFMTHFWQINGASLWDASLKTVIKSLWVHLGSLCLSVSL